MRWREASADTDVGGGSVAGSGVRERGEGGI